MVHVMAWIEINVMFRGKWLFLTFKKKILTICLKWEMNEQMQAQRKRQQQNKTEKDADRCWSQKPDDEWFRIESGRMPEIGSSQWIKW